MMGWENFLISFIIINLIGVSFTAERLRDNFTKENFNKMMVFANSAGSLMVIISAIGIFGFLLALLGLLF